MQQLAAAIQHLCRAPLERDEALDLAAWNRRYRSLVAQWPAPAVRALVAGFEAPGVAYAFAAGYQCALERLLGADPDTAQRALCVTEREGNRPRQIHTRLYRTGNGWLLDGEKSYVTGGTHAEVLCVAARLADSPADRPAIRMTCIPATRAGIALLPLPTASFVPELPHCRVQLHEVAVAEHEVLPGDGYERYVKLFRTLEDTQVELALVGQLALRARRLPDGAVLIDRLLAQAAALLATSELPPDEPAAHLLLAGIRASFAALLAELETAWQRDDPRCHALWLRDRKLLQVAQAAREARTARARQRIPAGARA